MAKLISLTGPESTGKSTLSRSLSEHFNTEMIIEVARNYLAHRDDGSYELEDVLEIARLQHEQEIKLTDTEGIVFCDTDLMVIKVWLELKFEHSEDWIEEYLSTKPYFHTLLLYPDVPWEYDPLRENPEDREMIYTAYQSHLSSLSLPFSVIKGLGDQRLTKAIEIVESLQA